MAALLLVWGDDPLARLADGRSTEEVALAAGATAGGQLLPAKGTGSCRRRCCSEREKCRERKEELTHEKPGHWGGTCAGECGRPPAARPAYGRGSPR